MKNLFICLFLTISSITIYPQGSRNFLKWLPPIDASTPDWAIEMYSENPNFFKVNDLYNEWRKTHPDEKNAHTQNYKMWTRMVEQYIDETGHFNTDKVEKRSDETITGVLHKSEPQQIDNTLSSTWILHGPQETYSGSGGSTYNWQANVYCIDQSITNPAILFAGTEAGGVYKSTDYGATWTNAVSSFFYGGGSIDDIKIDPTNENMIFFISGTSLYRSTNGGMNWVANGSPGNSTYQIDYCYDETNIYRLFATDAGIKVRSYDRINPNTQGTLTSKTSYKAWDVKRHPTNPGIAYALQTSSNGKLIQFYKSTDYGATWTQKTSGWYTSADVNAIDAGGRIAVTQADPNIVYCVLIGQSKTGDNGWIGVWKSTDAGETWANTNAAGQVGAPSGGYSNSDNTKYNLATRDQAGTISGQGFFNLAIAVSQTDANILYVGNLCLFKSTDGGASWNLLGGYGGPYGQGVHPDIQDLLTSVDAGHFDRLYMANDGGVSYSDDNFATVPVNSSVGLYAADYWGFSQGWNEDVIVGGKYHNGNSVWVEGYGAGSYKYIGGGESPTGYVNPFFSKKTYFDDINSSPTLSSTLTGSNTNSSELSLYPNSSYNVSRSSEIEWDPRYADHFYLGNENKFYKTTDGGATFNSLYTFEGYGNVYEIEVSRSNPLVIYCAVQRSSSTSDKIDLFRSGDGGNNWNKILGNGVGSLKNSSNVETTDANKPTKIEITLNPSDENELWFANGGTAVADQVYKVFRTTNGGSTWENKTGTLAGNVEIRDILFQGGSNGIVYIAQRTSSGLNTCVYYWNPGTSAWVAYNTGLLRTINPLQMRPFYRDNKLRLATRGNGVWEVDMVTPSSGSLIVQPMTKQDTTYCSRDFIQFDSYSMIPQESSTYLWQVSPAPASISDPAARNPLIKFGASGTYTITLTVNGGTSKSIAVNVDSQCDPQGIPGRSMSFATTSDYLQTPLLNLTTNTFTISAWVKPNGTQPDYSAIAMNNGTAMGLNFRGGNNTLGYHWDGSDWSWNSGLIVPSGVWSHIAMVVTPANVTLYLNGVPSVHNSSVASQAFTSLNIGRYQSNTSRSYKGEIDELLLINRVLTISEIRELRHLTKNSLSSDPDVIAYYQFNVVGNPALDAIGVNHATINGSALYVDSNAPIASGNYARSSITGQGIFNFTNSKASFNFNGTGSNPNGELVVSQLANQPNTLPVGKSSPSYYWVINNYGTNSFTGLDKIVFSYPGGPTVAAAADPSQIKLYKRSDNDTGPWTEVLTASNIVAGSDGYFEFYNSGNAVQSFSQFMIGMPESALPVELTEFTGNRTGEGTVLLRWETATESNNYGFEIERQYFDEKTNEEWIKVGFVGGHGTSNSKKKYSFSDKSIAVGKEFIRYRLKQIDINGAFKYYQSIEIDGTIIPTEYEMSQNFPNPFNSRSRIKFSIPHKGITNITVYDILGNKVEELIDKELSPGYHEVIFESSKYTSGVYVYTMKSGNFSQSRKMVILK